MLIPYRTVWQPPSPDEVPKETRCPISDFFWVLALVIGAPAFTMLAWFMASQKADSEVTEILVVASIHQTRFGEDYVEFAQEDGSRSFYWMSGPRYQPHTFPFHVGDKVKIRHQKGRNNTTTLILPVGPSTPP